MSQAKIEIAGEKVLVNGVDVTEAIRTQAVTSKVSAIAALGVVRTELVKQQQAIGANGGIVAEGRDMCTHVFPTARVKIFLTASVRERARALKVPCERVERFKVAHGLGFERSQPFGPSAQLSKDVAAFLAAAMRKRCSFNQGLVALLELLYEHLGLKADFEGQVILEEIINLLETEVDQRAEQHEQSRPGNPLTESAPPLPDLSSKAKSTEALAPKKQKQQQQRSSDSRSEDSEKQVRPEVPAAPKKKQQATAQAEDDGWGSGLQITTYTSEDLKRERLADPEEKRYLTVADLSPDYQHDYIEEFDEEIFSRVEEKFRDCRLVGVDVECHLRKEKATYMQLSTDSYGIIFNIRSIKLREHQRVQAFMRRLLETTEVKKVGHSLSHDRKMIKQAFFGDIEFTGNASLEDIYFTAPLKTNVLGLSSMCLRAFGFPLNKDLQSHIGEQESLYTEEEKEYAILDALAPVTLYKKFEKAINTRIPPTKFVANCPDRQAVRRDRVLIDHNLELLRVYFLQKNIEFEILKDKTYQGSRP